MLVGLERIGVGVVGAVVVVLSLFLLKMVLVGRSRAGDGGPVVFGVLGHFPTFPMIAAMAPFAIPLTILIVGGAMLYDAVTGTGMVAVVESGSPAGFFDAPSTNDTHTVLDGWVKTWLAQAPKNPPTVVSARPGAVIRSCPKTSCAAIFQFQADTSRRLLVVDDLDADGNRIPAESNGWTRTNNGMFGRLWLKTTAVAPIGSSDVVRPVQDAVVPAAMVTVKPGTKLYECPKASCASPVHVGDDGHMQLDDDAVDGAPGWVQVQAQHSPKIYFAEQSALEK